MIRNIDMRGRIKHSAVSAVDLFRQKILPFFVQNRFFRIVAVVSLIAVAYWCFFASDRFVSEAHIIIKKVDIAGNSTHSFDLSSVLSNGSGNKTEQLLLRDHLLSVDMLKKLDTRLDLKAHYGSWWRDPFSRMWLSSQEWFHQYYLSRISVELDEYSGVLVIRAQAFTAEMAHAIGLMLVEEGGSYMNELAHRSAREQVTFLEKEVAQIGERAIKARQSVINFQNQKGLISPQSTAESLAGIVNSLEGKLTELKTRRTAVLGYLSPTAPGIIDLNLQIAAVEKQIVDERGRLASPSGKTLNRAVEEYQRLQMSAELAQDMYKTALLALEKGRIEAMRTINMVSVLQAPTRPEYPLEPKRLYNSFVFTIITFLFAGIVHLVMAIIREHKD